MGERLLASVHGVSSDTVRFTKLSEEVAAVANYDAIVAVNYGQQRPLKAIDKQTKFLVFQNVALSLIAAYEGSRRNTGDDPVVDVIAHSFGTLAVYRALSENAVTIRQLVLIGCIMDRWTNWDPLVKRGLRCPPLNIVRPFDMVVPHAHFVGGDTSGCRGFSPQGRCHAVNHFVDGGHNDYPKDGTVISQFLTGTWSRSDAIDEEAFISGLPLLRRARLKSLRACRML